MSAPYPWIKDSQYLTPSVTGYLAVTSTNGLYLTNGVSTTIINSTSVTSTNLNGALTGNATTATTATNIAGGSGGQIPYQGSVNNTAFLANGTAGQVLQSNGTTLAPSWVAPGGSTPTLSAVLTAGNSAGSTSINMNNQNITGVLNIVGSTTVGNDLNISTTQNLFMSADNIDVSTTEIIYPTLTTPNRVRIKATGQVQVDNTASGNPTTTPALVLNQVSLTGTVLTEEFYNQRTATSGEFNRMSFYAKNSAGTKTEFGRINKTATVITASNVKGRMDFAVGDGGGLQDYLSLNANTSQVDILNSDLDLNTNDIVNVPFITTPLLNQYSKEKVVYLNTNATAPTATLESNLRYTAFNIGKLPEWIQATGITSNGFISGAENITASQTSWDGQFWVGTEIGNVYYSSDGGNNWTLQGSYNGRIRCFQPYNFNSVMAVGGDFTGTYNYLFGILATSYSSVDLTPFGGMNAPVFCFYDNTTYSCLYIGGAFDDFFNNISKNYKKWVTLDYNLNSFIAFSNSSGDGFFGGDVLSINKDINNSQFIIVGGSFTNLTVNSSPISIPYLFTYITTNGYDLTSGFSVGLDLNDFVTSIIPISGGLLVGGNFSNSSGYSFCNTNYGFYMIWNGSNWELYDYTLFNPSGIINSITFIPFLGLYYTVSNYNTVFINGLQTITIPVGFNWNCVAYNGTNVLYATDAQNSIGFLFYQYDQNVSLTINGGGNIFNTTGGSFTNCLLIFTNSAVEMMWNSSLNKWFVISQESCQFF